MPMKHGIDTGTIAFSFEKDFQSGILILESRFYRPYKP